MHCENCGSEIKAGNQFCENCGQKMSEVTTKKRNLSFNPFLIVFIILIVIGVGAAYFTGFFTKIEPSSSNAEAKGAICNAPYILVGTECCLDKDANSICDKDEEAKLVQPQQKAPYCGDGICQSSESCSSCQSDCGECQPQYYCGDGICSATESCSTCSSDCGNCPRINLQKELTVRIGPGTKTDYNKIKAYRSEITAKGGTTLIWIEFPLEISGKVSKIGLGNFDCTASNYGLVTSVEDNKNIYRVKSPSYENFDFSIDMSEISFSGGSSGVLNTGTGGGTKILQAEDTTASLNFGLVLRGTTSTQMRCFASIVAEEPPLSSQLEFYVDYRGN